MNRPLAALSMAAALALGLTGCGGQDTPPAPQLDGNSSAPTGVPAPVTQKVETWAPGTYTFEAVGTTGTLTFPAQPDPDLEQLRVTIGADPLTYMEVQVDNRAGQTNAPIYEVNVYDKDGREYKFVDVNSVLAYEPAWDLTNESNELYNQGVELNNRWMNLGNIGQVSDVVLVGQFPETELPADGITRVAVLPFDGFEEYEAEPAG